MDETNGVTVYYQVAITGHLSALLGGGIYTHCSTDIFASKELAEGHVEQFVVMWQFLGSPLSLEDVLHVEIKELRLANRAEEE